MAGLTVTLTSLLADARVYLDEASANQWSDAAITTAINYAYWDCLKKIEELCDTRLTSQGNITFIANQQEYDLPTGCNVVLDVRDNANSIPIPVLRYSDRTFYEQGGWIMPIQPIEGTRIAYLRNDKIGFAPAPTEASTAAVTITYVADQTILATGTDALTIPTKFKELVVLGAVKRCAGMRAEPFDPHLQDILNEQWAQFVTLIENRNAQDGAEFRWGDANTAGRPGFTHMGYPA